MFSATLLFPETQSKASHGSVKAAAIGHPSIDTKNVIFIELSPEIGGGGIILGIDQPNDIRMALGHPKISGDEQRTLEYPKDFEGEFPYPQWEYRYGNNFLTAKTGTMTITFSDNQKHAVGHFKFTTEGSIEVKGEFDVKRDD